MSGLDNIDIKLNQNVWLLALSFATLGCAEYFELPKLLCFANYLCWISTISVTITLSAYTVSYVINKFKKKGN